MTHAAEQIVFFYGSRAEADEFIYGHVLCGVDMKWKTERGGGTPRWISTNAIHVSEWDDRPKRAPKFEKCPECDALITLHALEGS